MIRRFIWFASMFVLCLPVWGANPDRTNPADLFKGLRKLDQRTDVFREYYDLHGNACHDLQALMIGRFEFTTNICNELDSVDPESLPGYVAALYDVQATVKDPASIPWLESRLAGPKRVEIYVHCLPRCRTYLRGSGPEQAKWMADPEKWEAFFQRWAEGEKVSTLRVQVLHVMQGWCHAPGTLEFFAKLEQDPKTDREELLVAQLYLQQHGKAPDINRMRQAIELLRNSKNGQKILLEFAETMRQEAFVPWLLSVIEENPKTEFGDAQLTLEKITFRRDISGNEAWKKWFAQHRMEGRSKWLSDASAGILQLATTNLPAAGEFLDKAEYRWNDPALLSTMERLVAYKALHDEIVGWINLTYAEYPHLPEFREKLRVLAVRIRDESENNLKDWAKGLMRGWDFLYEDKTTWEEYVRLSNSLL